MSNNFDIDVKDFGGWADAIGEFDDINEEVNEIVKKMGETVREQLAAHAIPGDVANVLVNSYEDTLSKRFADFDELFEAYIKAQSTDMNAASEMSANITQAIRNWQ